MLLRIWSGVGFSDPVKTTSRSGTPDMVLLRTPIDMMIKIPAPDTPVTLNLAI
jgi:hypothetical protein